MKNLAMSGGLFYVAAYRAGQLSLDVGLIKQRRLQVLQRSVFLEPS
ncbi:MAG TPA: hypothetical protein VN666_04230 [Nitrospira sp.]|nr:hypothetical protein [Nitrospira sp.]